jgi:hypothetical protein
MTGLNSVRGSEMAQHHGPAEHLWGRSRAIARRLPERRGPLQLRSPFRAFGDPKKCAALVVQGAERAWDLTPHIGFEKAAKISLAAYREDQPA